MLLPPDNSRHDARTGREGGVAPVELADVFVPPSLRDGSRRVVVVPVGRFDLRATLPLQQAQRITADQLVAVHVQVNETVLWQLGQAWMDASPGVPLHVVASDGGVARTITRVVEGALTVGYGEVIVLIGCVAFRHRYQQLVHSRMADSIARAVERIPGATVAVCTVATV